MRPTHHNSRPSQRQGMYKRRRSSLARLAALLLPVAVLSLMYWLPTQLLRWPSRKFRPGVPWLDTHGNLIQAHGGGVLLHNGVYYWYGEDKGGPTIYPQLYPPPEKYTPNRVDVIGVHCYSSLDLVTWRDEGLVLRAGEHPDLDPSRVVERPKVIYNSQHERFVMWMHIDDEHYEEARAGVAWSLSPTGPFRYVGSVRPNDEMSRDMTLFKDDDESGWLIYTSEHNQVMHIAQLAGDYMSVQPQFIRVAINQTRESPAVFKHEGRYYLLTSNCTGWAPNPAEVFTATSMEGPWESVGNPCRDLNPQQCDFFFISQNTHVLPAPGHEGRGHFIMLADRWSEMDLGNSRYIWLPMWVRSPQQEGEKASIAVRWYNEWDLRVFDRPQMDTFTPLPLSLLPLRSLGLDPMWDEEDVDEIAGEDGGQQGADYGEPF